MEIVKKSVHCQKGTTYPDKSWQNPDKKYPKKNPKTFFVKISSPWFKNFHPLKSHRMEEFIYIFVKDIPKISWYYPDNPDKWTPWIEYNECHANCGHPHPQCVYINGEYSGQYCLFFHSSKFWASLFFPCFSRP